MVATMSPPVARALSFLKEALNVREGEGLRVLSLAAYLVLTVSTFITGRIQRDSLFLSAFDKEDLAWMYISVAVMVPLPALLFSRVADRFYVIDEGRVVEEIDQGTLTRETARVEALLGV